MANSHNTRRRIERQALRQHRHMRQVADAATLAMNEEGRTFIYSAEKTAASLHEASEIKAHYDDSDMPVDVDTLFEELAEAYIERMKQISHEAGLKIIDLVGSMAPALEDEEGLIERVGDTIRWMRQNGDGF